MVRLRRATERLGATVKPSRGKRCLFGRSALLCSEGPVGLSRWTGVALGRALRHLARPALDATKWAK
eukprot:7280849-Alexandrium_andersonii.AAC.1